MSINSAEFDFLELPAGGINPDHLEDDPFGFAPKREQKPQQLASATLIVTDAVLVPYTETTIGELSEKYLGLKINGIGDSKGLAKAKEAKGECVSVRTGIEKVRVELKKPYLEMGKRIDAEAKRLQSLLEPIESYIGMQIETVEKSLKKIEQERQNRVYEQRLKELTAINLGLPEASVRAMSDEEFANLIESKLKEYEEHLEESQRRAEEQRLLDAERAKQREEADRLAAERAEMQRKQDAADAELARQREELAAQQREFERQKAAAAKAEQDRLDAIAREKQQELDRIAREKQIAEAKARAEKMRPFSERLVVFSQHVAAMAQEAPTCEDSLINTNVAKAVQDAAAEIAWIAKGLVSVDPVQPEMGDFNDI